MFLLLLLLRHSIHKAVTERALVLRFCRIVNSFKFLDETFAWLEVKLEANTVLGLVFDSEVFQDELEGGTEEVVVWGSKELLEVFKDKDVLFVKEMDPVLNWGFLPLISYRLQLSFRLDDGDQFIL
jgi:hypothetical protein